MKTFSNIFCSTSVGAGDIWIYFKFQTSEVSIKTFWTKWDRENLPKWFFIETWKMPKRILSWQSRFDKFLQTYLFARSNAARFSSKKESVIILKMTNFWRKNLAIFHDVKKQRFIFFLHICLLYLLTRNFFFSKIYREAIKNIFHNI